MAKLRGVKELSADVIEYNGREFVKVGSRRDVSEGYIVKNVSEDDRYMTIDDFFEVTDVDGGDFIIVDNDGDERERSYNDTDFDIYEPRNGASTGADVQEIVINSPVRLIINGPVTIEIKSEAKFQ